MNECEYILRKQIYINKRISKVNKNNIIFQREFPREMLIDDDNN